jgi:hypothetical protein
MYVALCVFLYSENDVQNYWLESQEPDYGESHIKYV